MKALEILNLLESQEVQILLESSYTREHYIYKKDNKTGWVLHIEDFELNINHHFTHDPSLFDKISKDGNSKYYITIVDRKIKLEDTKKPLPLIDLSNEEIVVETWNKKYFPLLELTDSLEILHGNLHLEENTHITSLPKNLKLSGKGFDGNLQLNRVTIRLPDNLIVANDVELSNSKITSLPDNLEVGNFLFLTDCNKLTSIKNSNIKADSINLTNTPITYLPDNIKVNNLTLKGTKITSLPNNFKISGWLDLSHTPITSLPDNLEVGGDLNLKGSKITSLPDNLKVGGILRLVDTPITSLPKNLKVRSLFLNDHITHLPDDLEVRNTLVLNSNITSLPDNIKEYVRFLQIPNRIKGTIKIPKGIKVKYY